MGGRFPLGVVSGAIAGQAGVASGTVGSSAPAPEPVEAGVWQQLTFASQTRKVLLVAGSGGVHAFTPTKALAVEAQSPQLVSAVPARGFSTPFLGERGTFYFVGGLHSNYQGNEIDKMILPLNSSTVITGDFSHQPNIPPEGQASGYGSGSGGYVYRQYGGGLADYSDWQPYPGHQWTKNTWNQYMGATSFTCHAIQASAGGGAPAYPNGVYQFNGDGTLQSTGAQPGTGSAEHYGFVGFDWNTRKYKTYLSTTIEGTTFDGYLMAQTGVSDWNEWSTEFIMLHTNSGQTRIKRWSPSNGVQHLASTYMVGGADSTGGNGVLVRHIEHRKYLMLVSGTSTAPPLDRVRLLLYSEDFGVGDARFKTLTIPPEAAVGVATAFPLWLTFCVDKSSRRVFWAVYPQTAGVPWRFYVSTFDDLMAWTQLLITPTFASSGAPYEDAFLDARKQPMHFQAGYLFFCGGPAHSSLVNPGFIDGIANWMRAKIDGADLPSMTFQMFRYRDQNFKFSVADFMELSQCKHVNWAYRPVDDTHYMCSGDCGASFTSSMGTLKFDGTPRGYTYAELKDETTPPAGHVRVGGVDADATPQTNVRPVAPDDGAWFYSDSTNPNPAFRDKMIFVRGGDGIGWSSNIFTRAAYASFAANPGSWNSGGPDAAAEAAMKEDGWSMDRLMVFDPVTAQFDELKPATWPWDDGDTTLNHPAQIAANTARGGAFDVATNCVFRFTNFSNSMWLVKYDLTAKTIRGWNVSSWWDNAGLFGPAGRRWFLDNASPPNKEAVVASGFGHYSTGDERWHACAAHAWEHKAYWIDSTDGKLYLVSPQTGFLWCYETRGAESSFGGGGDGPTIPYYPLGQRIPCVGTYPAMDSYDRYPAVIAGTNGSTNNGSMFMESFMVPFKGGILWWSCQHFDGGTFGHMRHAFWRAIGDEGKWTPVSFPQNLTAQGYSCRTLHRDNTEVVLLHGGGTPYTYGYGADSAYFWRMT